MHLLVEAIHGQQVRAPARGVHAIPCGTGGSDMIHEAGESLAPGQFRPFHAPLHAHLPQPIGRVSPAALYILPGNSQADVHGQAEIAARKETPLMGISLMGGDEIMAGHAILVGEDEVVGLGPQQSDVQDARLPEALVLVPYVGEGQFVLVGVYQCLGLRPGTVISDDNLVRRPRLAHISPKGFLQPKGIVISGNDNAYRKSSHACLSYCSVG